MRTLLVIGYVWPEPTSSAAGTRMVQLLENFLSHSYAVTFATTAAPTAFMRDLEDMGVETAKIELNNSSFDSFLLELQPDVVLFDRFMMEEQFGWRVNKICPAAIRILDTEDLHFLRDYRDRKQRGQSKVSLKTSELAKREIASIYRCDLSLIISEAEIKLLLEEFQVPSNLLLYLPFLFETISEESIQELPKFEERKNFISIGNFKHAPNVDAVFFLSREIWPLIRKELPEAKMLVCGAYPPQKILELNNPRGKFHVLGRVEDSPEAVKKARVSLAPLRFGAGLKGKLAEAMQCGTPTVTTPTGAEGMKGSEEWNGAITDDPVLFAREAIKLYKDRDAWEAARQNGFRIINDRFAKEKYCDILINKILEIQQNKENHREENFTGAMLMHHRTKSTYYLSRYIEIKNELNN